MEEEVQADTFEDNEGSQEEDQDDDEDELQSEDLDNQEDELSEADLEYTSQGGNPDFDEYMDQEIDLKKAYLEDMEMSKMSKKEVKKE